MYDPLKHQTPGRGEPYPASYWADSSGSAPIDDGPINSDINVDVAIIGSGYTGLSCAIHLAEQQGIKSHILEANQTAWGCSGRNAGFILKSTGRKPYSSMIRQWGKETAQGIYNEVCEGVETVNQLIDGISQQTDIDCEPQSKGYLRVAHKPSMVKELYQQSKLLEKEFGYSTEILSAEQIKQQYFDSQDAFGAIRFSDGYGINPLKLAWGYQQLARQAGVKIHTGSPVTNWQKNESKKQQLHTPNGIVTADKVVIATNGYTPKGFHDAVDNRTLPVLSQIIVTEPLSESQLAETNFITDNVVMDTRALKYYFRKLPDNRILFGGRGAISGKDADDPYFANRLLKVLRKSFAPLDSINFDYSWSGWISVSLDDLPHICQADEHGHVFYSMGYCGNGVSFAVQAGKRLAERVAGIELPTVPLYSKQLPKFPFAKFRRVGQWGYFHYGKVKDRWF
jgi:glycine/D-amino acid oxidase-like deaminating enzyme